MMKVVAVLLGLGLAVVAGDPVIAKYDDGGPRYQYMTGPDGPELVDLWFKKSDLEQSARYNPDVNNHYHLFTRSNRNHGQHLPIGNDDVLRNSNYRADRKTVVLIHGWRNVPTSDFNVHLNYAYLAGEDVNVILVDWSVGAGTNYVTAANNLIRSAEHVARFLTWLIDSSGGDISNFHVIGHSLGAHQAGIVGRHLGGRIPYLTGLDPALPGWVTNPHAISPEVAVYTEIMHTDAGYSGIVRQAGHVDFYPNTGRGMPGCGDNNCSHHRCIFYMAESLQFGGFTGRRCDSVTSALSGRCDLPETLRMGGRDAKTGSTGIFYLQTAAAPPFSRG